MKKWEWFEFGKMSNRVPYEDMWEDDQYWLSQVLEGKNVEGKFIFDHPSTAENVAKILYKKLKEVAEIKQEVGNEQKP